MAYESHDEYFASVADDVRLKLAAIQAQVEALVPGATRCIGYNMPAYRGKRIFFYFAAFKKHIGIYPPVSEDERLIGELARFRGEKGNLSFPLNESLPLELIGRVAGALYRKYGLK
jgi:uncharacterized protein YdhG (YjbR/CyaY superfamily)